MSFLNANANQVFCKLAVHGEGAAQLVEALASLPGLYSPDDPGFRVVELVVSGYAIGPYALRLCVYALDGGDDLHALLAGADAIAVIGTADLGAITPYVNERVPVVCAPDRGEPYPAIAIELGSIEGARAVLRALLPQIAEVARAKWLG